MGEKLEFYLSLGLFSSLGVDSGTRMLLKTLAQQDIIPEKGSVLDVGCGTGVIAVSLKKRFPQLDVTASDRDALAIHFTKLNASLNKLSGEGFKTLPGLLPGSLPADLAAAEKKYDLITSNIPAKAGNPVIKDFLQNCGKHINNGGRAAVVIVAPLAGFAKECLDECGADITHIEEDKKYSVFHFKPGSQHKNSSLADIYIRSKGTVSGFYGLPEFDSISYSTRLTIETLNSFNAAGTALIWNPGIGHIMEGCPSVEEIILAGNDLLQLKASAYNNKKESAQYHIAKFPDLKEYVFKNIDLIIALPQFISGAGIENEIISTSNQLLISKGRLIISGKSSDMARIEKNRQNFIIRNSTKYRGFRTLLLEKK